MPIPGGICRDNIQETMRRNANELQNREDDENGANGAEEAVNYLSSIHPAILINDFNYLK